jgi:hypothetical protein
MVANQISLSPYLSPQLRKGAWLKRSFTLSTPQLLNSASAARTSITPHCGNLSAGFIMNALAGCVIYRPASLWMH